MPDAVLLPHRGCLDQRPFPGLVTAQQHDWRTLEGGGIPAESLSPKRHRPSAAVAIVLPQEVNLAGGVPNHRGVDGTAEIGLADEWASVPINERPCGIRTLPPPNTLSIAGSIPRGVEQHVSPADREHCRCPRVPLSDCCPGRQQRH